jgi:hypothetical protein
MIPSPNAAIRTNLQRDGLGIPVENEYRCVEYPTQRIEDVQIGRLGEAERSEGYLHPRGRVTQQMTAQHLPTNIAESQPSRLIFFRASWAKWQAGIPWASVAERSKFG